MVDYVPIHQMIRTPDIVGNFQQGLRFGQEQRQQRIQEEERQQLRNLAPKIMQGDPSAYTQAATISPDAANTYQDSGDRNYRRVTNVAKLMREAINTNNPQAKQQAFSQIRPFLSELAGGRPVPETWDDSLLPGFEQFEARVQQAQQPNQQQRNLAVSPGSAIVDPETGSVIYERPFAPQSQTFEFSGPDGRPRRYTFNTRTGEYEEAAMGGGSPSLPLSSSAGGPQGVYASLADKHGFQTTSTTRSPDENSRVGGVPNSQHLSGTARDFSVRGKTPDQINAFVKDLRAQGFEVITRDHGTGPHIHAELPSPSGGGQPLVGRSKEEEAGAVEAAKIQAQLNAAPQVSAADAQAAELKTEAEERAKSGAERAKKIPQYQNVERGLTRIDNALRALQGKFVDTGPLDQYAVMMTNEGQELAAAVGAIQNDMLALTRVPGVGSQSDLEQRIANLKYPDLRYHPSVNQANLQQLRSFVNDLGESLGSGSQKAGAVRRARNPQTGEVLILVNGQWVPENGR